MRNDVGPLNFWSSLSVDELAKMQNVKPTMNIESLAGTWPGEDDDGFEDDIKSMRESSQAKQKQVRRIPYFRIDKKKC